MTAMTREVLQLRALRRLTVDLELLAEQLRDEAAEVEMYAAALQATLTPQGPNLRLQGLQRLRVLLRHLDRQEQARLVMDYERLLRGEDVKFNRLANEIIDDENECDER
jgi:hypothetical protein